MVCQREATIEDLYHTPDDGKYEFVDGRLRHMSPTGVCPGHAALRIAAALCDMKTKLLVAVRLGITEALSLTCHTAIHSAPMPSTRTMS